MLSRTGRISKVTTDINGNMQLILDINEPEALRIGFDRYHDRNIDIKIADHKQAKSNEANAYFHALTREIAAALTVSFQEANRNLMKTEKKSFMPQTLL